MKDYFFNTSLVAPGALAHRLQRLQNPKWPPGGPKMAARGPQNGGQGLERDLTLGYWPFRAIFAK